MDPTPQSNPSDGVDAPQRSGTTRLGSGNRRGRGPDQIRVCFLAWLLLLTAGVQLAAAQDGSEDAVQIVAEVNGAVAVPRAHSLNLAAWRVTMPPGTVLRPATLPGPVLIAVESGELIVGGPQRQWEGRTSRLVAGEIATLEAGARIRPRVDGTAPTTFLIVSLSPVAPADDGTVVTSRGWIQPMEEAT